MDLDTLNLLVTEAILKAETLDELKAPGAKAAYRDVASFEKKIAELLPATDAEGAIARRGAVRAAVSAGAFKLAVKLADQYLSDAELDTCTRTELLRMRRRNTAKVSLRKKAAGVSPAKTRNVSQPSR